MTTLITGLDRMERRLIVAALRVQVASCHIWDCPRCTEIRALLTRLESPEDAS